MGIVVSGSVHGTKRFVTSLATAALILTLLYGAGNARAHEGAWIDSVYTVPTPTIDGTLSPGEWTSAELVDLTTIPGNGLPAALLVANNDTFLFIAYDAVGDTVADRVDGASVSFDTGHDLAMTVGREDEFWWGPGAPNTEAHLVSDGSSWQVQDSPFDPGLPNQAGLAAASGFGPSDLSGNPHAVYELQIPLVLLGLAPGDVVGFLGASSPYPGVVDGTAFQYSTWPRFFFGPPTLDRYGDLRLGKAAQPDDLDLNPPSQSQLAPPSTSILYTVTAVNTGTATDTFDITANSPWTPTLLDATGINPLPDTDADLAPDTGPVAPGASADFMVRIDVPATTGCAESRIAGNSSNDPGISDVATLRTCVPPSLLNPPHSDMGVDTDAPPNGLFDELEIDVGVYTTSPGMYNVQVLLYDQMQTTVITAGFSSAFLGPGPSFVPVFLSGVPIYQSGFDGPYAAVLFLIDSGGNLIDQGLYMTAPYLSTDFDPPGARFTPPHSDRGVDTDVPPNGLYDVLAVDVSLAVTDAGTYNLFSLLTDLSGNFISTFATGGTFAVGSQTLTLDFPGRDIYTRGFDGPYVVYMDLFDDLGNFLGTDVHLTGMYTSSQFEPPAAVFSPPHGDRGVDLTVPPDGLYEFLEVNASVVVSKAGQYSLDVLLWDPTFSFILVIATVTVDLAVGPHVVPIWFDGLQIRAAGFDGPYIADMFLTDSLGFLDEDLHLTGPYSVGDFAPPGAQFVPPHSGRLVDADADGRADFLAVDAQIDVTIPGTYSVSGLLQDSRGRFLDVASGCGAPLPSGPATCTLMFDGHAIADNGQDGPFFAILRLTDAYGRLLGVDSFMTQSYAASLFEPSDTTRPTATASPVPYWVNQAPLDVPFTASDPAPTDGLASVTLWYRHSTDNTTWGAWTPFLTATVASNPATGSIPFSFPSGVGFYEFQYTATDRAGNDEVAGGGEARAVYRPAASLAFAPNAITISAGQQQTTQVRVLGLDGQPAVLASALTVSLTTNSPTGEFRSVGTATTIVSVTIPAGQSSASVDYYDETKGTWALRASSGPTTDGVGQATVNAGAADSVTIAPSSAAVAVGGALSFTAEARDLFGNLVAASFTWSADPALGTIDAAGLLTAANTVASGTVTVDVVGSPSVTATADVTLVPGPAASVVVTPSSVTLAVARTQTFTAQVLDQYGNAVTASVTWSATAAIGTISAGGVLTAANTVASGTVTATVVGSPTVTGTAAVTIVPGAASTITLSPTSATLAVDGTTAFTATVRDALGNTITNAPLSWSVGGGVGSVSASGAFTAGHAVGSGQVQATSGTATASAAITVTAGPVARVVVSPPNKVVTVGTTTAFAAQAYDQYGNAAAGTISWTATGDVGTIDSSGTLAAAQEVSTGNVWATVGTITGVGVVTLVHDNATSVQITPASATVQYGSSLGLRAVVVDQYGNEISDAPVSWSASGPGTLTDTTGATTTLIAASAGRVTVTATSGSVSASAPITVLGPPEPSNAPVIGGGALVAGLLAGIALGWFVRGRRGKREAEPSDEPEPAKEQEPAKQEDL